MIVPILCEHYNFHSLKKTDQSISKKVGGVRMNALGNILCAEEMLKHAPGNNQIDLLIVNHPHNYNCSDSIYIF